ncbi:MAG: exosortase system-associated protein, TIGR04073 family [Candidatus Omnitrophota bacterium]|nr:exosortase system-associated protein, TIGR04073 family [Candidatus Omnitrophota bacterium]
MVKKSVSILVMCVFLMTASVSYAASDDLLTGMGQKLFRGVINVVTGWVEIPAQIIKGYDRGFNGNENNKIVGLVVGVFKGLGDATGRTLSGVADVAGFWAADPDSNEGIGIPLDAEYAWQEGTAYNIFDPNLGEGAFKPIAGKLLRGIGNTVLGIIEIPGQIVKGVKDGAPDLGIIKGIWYFASREMDGASDIYTFYMANPKETKGLAFDETWPWSAFGENIK